MEGRFPHGVRLVLTNCMEPSREREFNRWYDQVHVTDLLEAGVASHGLRYQNAEPQLGEAKYLAIYEVDREDLDRVDEEFARIADRLAERGRMHPALEIVNRGMWRRIGREFTTGKPAETRVAGIWILQSNCTDTAREAQFNTWYDATHIPDLLATGLFLAAYRFAAIGHRPSGSYLAIYETASDPTTAVKEFVRIHRPRLRKAGRLSDMIDVTWRGTFQQLAPATTHDRKD